MAAEAVTKGKCLETAGGSSYCRTQMAARRAGGAPWTLEMGGRTMRFPGFTAEASLFKTAEPYRLVGARAGGGGQAVIPQVCYPSFFGWCACCNFTASPPQLPCIALQVGQCAPGYGCCI